MCTWQKLEVLLVSFYVYSVVSFRGVDYDLDSSVSCGLDRKESEDVRARVQEPVSLILIYYISSYTTVMSAWS